MNPQYPYYNQQWGSPNQYYQPQQFSQTYISPPPQQFSQPNVPYPPQNYQHPQQQFSQTNIQFPQQTFSQANVPLPHQQYHSQQRFPSQTQQVIYPQLQQPFYPQLDQPFSSQTHSNHPNNYQSKNHQQQLYPDLPQPFSEPPNQPNHSHMSATQSSQQIEKPTVYYPYLAPCFEFNPNNFTESNNPWSASMWLQTPSVNYPTLSPLNLPQNSGIESVEQFQKLRHHATVESALGQLSELAIDLSRVDPNFFRPSSSSCFIVCNSYETPRLKLGVGPINDAITVAANHKYMGYTVYYLHNPHHQIFLNFLSVFLSNVYSYLTVYYSGHGAQKKDTSGDEADGYDEVMVFDSGRVVDDELALYLNKYSRGSAHTILISDCCHSGTIWDIPESLGAAASFPPNIMSISASNDSQTAKQTNIGNKNQGIFTFNFFALLRSKPYLAIGEAQKLLNPELKRFNQQIEFYPTRPEMLTKPIFPLMAQKQGYF